MSQPSNDFRAIRNARDQKRARLAAQHSGPDAPTINHGAASAAPTAVDTPTAARRDGDGQQVSWGWVSVAFIVGFLAGWYTLFLLIAGRE